MSGALDFLNGASEQTLYLTSGGIVVLGWWLGIVLMMLLMSLRVFIELGFDLLQWFRRKRS